MALSHPINHFALRLILRSQTPRVESKFETDDIVEIFAEGVKRSTAFKKVEKDLVLPKVMLKSNRRCCECVKIFYELKVEALLSMRAGYRQSVKMFFPIVIGSIPINNERPKTIDLRKSTPVREPSVISSRSNRSIPSVAPLLESRKLSKISSIEVINVIS